MVINDARELLEWCQAQAEATDALQGLDDSQAHTAVEDVCSVVWRHAHGQGMRVGEDWGWVLEMYDSNRIAEIVQASVEG